MLCRVGPRLAIPDRVLDRLLRHHVADVRLVEAAIARRAAHHAVEVAVALLPSVDHDVHADDDVHISENSGEHLHLLRVRVHDPLGLQTIC